MDPDGRDVPVMHACGHDVHVTCLVGASQVLAETRSSWSGTLVVVFQPAEEVGAGAQAMIDDGLFERFPRPQVVLGQHVAPFPAGFLAVRAGTAFAAADSLRVTMFGRGAHGSRPEVSVDPVVMAAATVLRLQTIASREIAGTDTAILTIGALRAGTKENIIPDDAELLLSLRTFDPAVRRRVLDAINRIVHGEATTSGAPRAPEVELTMSFPAVVNDLAAVDRSRPAFAALLGADRVLDPGVVTGSEDVGLLATAAEAPCVFWLLGGGDPRTSPGPAVPRRSSRSWAPCRPTIHRCTPRSRGQPSTSVSPPWSRQPANGYRRTRDPPVSKRLEVPDSEQPAILPLIAAAGTPELCVNGGRCRLRRKGPGWEPAGWVELRHDRRNLATILAGALSVSSVGIHKGRNRSGV